MISVHPLSVGPFQTNCFLLMNDDSKEIVVVDPGDDGETIAEFVERLGGKPVAIWNTHAHTDHVNANAYLHEKYGVPISIHEREAEWLHNIAYSLAPFVGLDFHPSRAEIEWKEGDRIAALGCVWEIHHVPGHSPGLVAIVCPAQNICMAGDFLMRGTVGRVDLPGSNPADMQRSLKSLFEDWGRDEWRVYSGHTPETTIGAERRTNPFVAEALAGRFA